MSCFLKNLTIGIVSFWLALGLAAGLAIAQEEVDVEGTQLVDLDNSGISSIGTFCSVADQIVRRSLNATDFLEGEKAVVAENDALFAEFAEIFYQAQQQSKVSFDEIKSKDAAAFMMVLKDEYDAYLRQQAIDGAAEQDKKEVEEKWSSFDIARTTLSVASIADPSGVVGVAAAYTYPTCGMKEAQTGTGGFCWKDSEGRGVGTLPTSLGRVADCPGGYTNTGLTCHPNQEGVFVQPSRMADCPEGYTNNGATCGKGGKTYPQGSRVADCPAGYTNNGATCGRGGGSYPLASRVADCPAGYTNNGLTCGRGGGSYPQASRVADCPAGYTNNGLTCGRTGHVYPQGSRAADCPSGYTNNGLTCGRSGDVYAQGSRAAECPSGYTNNGLTCGRSGHTYSKGCTTVFKKFHCRSGYTDTGCFCTRWPSTLGMGSMSCGANEKLLIGRCYAPCKAGYTNIGELCSKPPSTLGLASMSCSAGEKRVGGRCYKACRAGYTNIGELCTSISTLGLGSMSCKSGEKRVGGRCYSACKPGFTNIGELCTEVSTLGIDSMTCNSGEFRTGARCYKHCREGYTNIGELCTQVSTLGMSSMTCGENEFRNGARCYKNCRAGFTNIGEFCTEISTLGLNSMTCKGNEFKTGARCYQPCPAGYTNTGEFCQKSILGVSSMICKPGEVKDGARCYPADVCPTGKTLQHALCYNSCPNPNTKPIGPVCWAACTGKFSTPCGAGCATSDLECALATTDMVASPIEVVVSIASLGGYSSASSARKAATLAAKKTASIAAREVAQETAKKAGRALAREALERLSRETIEELSDDLLEAFIKYGDDLVEEGRETARAVYKRMLDSPVDRNTITEKEARALKHFGDDVRSEVVEQSQMAALNERLAFELREALENVAREEAEELANIDPNVLFKVGDAMVSSAKRAAARTKRFKDWVVRNNSRLVESAKSNIFEPIANSRIVKTVKNNAPTKKNLRKKSEILDIFFEQKDKLGANKLIASTRVARTCTKAGLNAAIEAVERTE